MKKAICALALLGAAATSQAGVLVTQNFDNVSNLSAAGWVQTNNSTPNLPAIATAWYQGDQSKFSAQEGAAESYIAANYNNGAADGIIDNWLISPEFTAVNRIAVTLWLRAFDDPGYFDQVSFGISNGSSNTVDFALNPSFVVNTGDWVKYTFNIAAQGVGANARFAINYNGSANNASYIGIDSLEISEIPEPASMLLLGTGLAGLIAARRRKQAA